MAKGEKFKKMLESEEIATYQALLGLLRYRRSIRGFRKEPVPRKLIEEMLDAARWAPSAGNAQPWEFVVVEDAGTIGRLADLYEYQMVEKKWLEGTREKWMRMYQGDTFPGLEDEDAMADLMTDVRGKAPFRKAPCMIFPLADERWHHALPLRTRLDKGKQHLISSMANAVFALHLAAASLKLATQWVSDFGSPWLSGMTGDLLGIPRNYLVYETLAVGYPSYYPKPRYVKPADELVHYEKYDSGKGRSEEDIRAYVANHIRPQLKFKL
jgi:nitroreductase